MKIGIKDLDAAIELKNNGMEVEVRDPDGTFRGDLVITKSSVIWCKGRTTRAKGVKFSWNQFIDAAESGAIVAVKSAPKPAAKKAAKKAVATK